jgi:O-antigen ligase
MAAPAFAPLSIAPATTWMHVARIAAYALIFCLVSRIARRSTRNLWLCAIPLMAIGVFEAVAGLTGESSSGVSGTYPSRNHFAGLLELVLPFLVTGGIALLFCKGRSPAHSLSNALSGCIVVALACVTFFAILSSLSKLGVLATLGSLFVMASLGLAAPLAGWKRSATVAAIGIGILIVFVFVTPASLVERYGVFVGSDPSEGRVPIAKDGLKLFSAYPAFGSGMGTFYPGLLRYQTYGVNLAWVHAHNDYLQLLAELGIVGVLIPLVLISIVTVRAVRAVLWHPAREVRLIGLACAGSLVAVLVHSTGDFNFYVLSNAMVMAWIVGLAAALPPAKKSGGQVVSTRAFAAGIPALALASFLSLHAAGWVVFLHLFQTDAVAELAFCRFGICQTERALAQLEAGVGGSEAGSLPPETLVRYLPRDPAGPYVWGSLGAALQAAGRMEQARYAFERSLALAPNSPPAFLMAADFHFEMGENDSGLDLVSRSLRTGPDFDGAAFGILEHWQAPIHEVLAGGLPDSRSSRVFLHRLMAANRETEAATTWEWMVRRGYVDDKTASDYAGFLIASKNPKAAMDAWALHAGHRMKGYPERNRIFNADFETDPATGPFDWWLEARSGVALDFDRTSVHSGRRSLRLQFDGTHNVGDLGVDQKLFLPQGLYRFRAFVRTLDVSTDEGVSFRIAFVDSPTQLDFTTDDLRGSNDWSLVEHVFEVPAGGGLATLSLVRRPSLKFDSLIRGTVWVDHLTIVPISSESLPNH